MRIYLPHIAESLWIDIFGLKDDTTWEIAPEEAERYGEAVYHIMEGHFYEFELSIKDFRLSEKDNIVVVSKINKHTGRLEPNIYVGTLTLEVLDKDSHSMGNFNIEVESTKAVYREDYRYMLKCITDKCTDLIMQIDSPVSQYYETNFEAKNHNLYQRFCFVKSEIDSDEFEEAVQRIVSSPKTQWKTFTEDKDIRNIRRFSQKNIRQLATSANRQYLPDNHFLVNKYRIDSVPDKIEVLRKTESIDNNENRFIKHALSVFLFFCENCEVKFQQYSRAKFEAALLVRKLSNILNQSFFKEISRPVFLKLNSPVLQRKGGYREVLNTWLKYDLAAKLVWEGGDDVYSGGKKDIATLYEYWLFFTLLDILQEIFKIDPAAIKDLLVFDKHNISLNLKQGKQIALKGIYESSVRRLNVQFYYNRSFGGGKIYPSSGSYTTTLRPDYTLSVWPAEITDINEAEQKEMITHIHFDAKYKVDNFYTSKAKNEELTETEKKDLFEEEKEERKGNFKNVDLLKMHAYKDAIRRTGGAYILYPGDGKTEPFRGFRELIPGLGAFVMKPNEENTGKNELKEFISKVINHFIDRSSQRENMTSKVYSIHKDEKPDENILQEPVPEFIQGEKLIPDETLVLVGFVKSNAQLDWIEKNNLYNFRAGSGRGALPLDYLDANAKYLLLHTYGEIKSGRLFRIKGKGPKIFTRYDLDQIDYPDPGSSFYLVYELDSEIEVEFQNRIWDITKLEGYRNGRDSALPLSIPLTKFMSAVEPV